MYNELEEVVQGNRYFMAIEECHRLIDEVGKKADILRNPQVEGPAKDTETPSANELERKLRELTNHLKELKNSIVS